MAAAAAIIVPFAPFAVAPPAQALPIPSCSEQLATLAAATGGVVPPGLAAQCDAAQAAEFAHPPSAQQPAQQPAGPPAAPPPGPCVMPHLGPTGPVNGDCGYQAAQCGVAALTGVGACAGGMPAAGPAPTGPTGPATGLQGPGPGPNNPANVSPAPGLNQINSGQPVQAPPECANLDYFIVNRIMCEQMGAPLPPGYTYGMNDTPPA